VFLNFREGRELSLVGFREEDKKGELSR